MCVATKRFKQKYHIRKLEPHIICANHASTSIPFCAGERITLKIYTDMTASETEMVLFPFAEGIYSHLHECEEGMEEKTVRSAPASGSPTSEISERTVTPNDIHGKKIGIDLV